MKYPAGPVKPRRLSAPKTAPKKKVRLDLKRRPEPKPEEDLEIRQKGHFWKWVILVALFHVVAISLFYFIYEFSSPVKPPQEFISLFPKATSSRERPARRKHPRSDQAHPRPRSITFPRQRPSTRHNRPSRSLSRRNHRRQPRSRFRRKRNSRPKRPASNRQNR